MRAVGELGVFRIMTKEIITASDHGLGDFGKRYLSWLLSSKRITLVIEFDVDFRYDLNDPVFRVDPTGEAEYRITLPPCQHRVLIRDMRIHSEDRAELLPWLMPDLVGRFFTGGFSVEAKNKLIAETREEATRFAGGPPPDDLHQTSPYPTGAQQHSVWVRRPASHISLRYL